MFSGEKKQQPGQSRGSAEEKLTGIAQFREKKFGRTVALSYSLLTMFLYGTLYLGGTLFWGGYSLEVLFGDQIQALVGGNPATHICAIIVLLGAFSAIYTYFGGLGAVVKTDIIQFVLLLGGGITVAYLALNKVGGWNELRLVAGDKLHLHYPTHTSSFPGWESWP